MCSEDNCHSSWFLITSLLEYNEVFGVTKTTQVIVIVIGLPGSGKSYFARRLATRLRAEHINSDTVRKAMGASGRYSFKEKLVVYTEMARMTEKFLDENKVVVVDATFYHHLMRDIFLQLAHQQSVRICFIQVRAKEGLIQERLSIPRDDSEADFKVYQDIRDQFQEIMIPHLELDSTNENITQMLDTAVEYVNSNHERK